MYVLLISHFFSANAWIFRPNSVCRKSGCVGLRCAHASPAPASLITRLVTQNNINQKGNNGNLVTVSVINRSVSSHRVTVSCYDIVSFDIEFITGGLFESLGTRHPESLATHKLCDISFEFPDFCENTVPCVRVVDLIIHLFTR